jgi:hypothetical protein
MADLMGAVTYEAMGHVKRCFMGHDTLQYTAKHRCKGIFHPRKPPLVLALLAAAEAVGED